MRVNHRGNGVGGIVKTVNKLKAKRNKQGHAQQNVGNPGDNFATGVSDVRNQTVASEQQADGEYAEKNNGGYRPGFMVEVGAGRRNRQCRCYGIHRFLSEKMKAVTILAVSDRDMTSGVLGLGYVIKP